MSDQHILPLTTGMVDLNRQTFTTQDGAVVKLTTKEVALLTYLREHSNRVVTRDELLENVWGYSSNVISRAADNSIARLRNKLEDDPKLPTHLLTVFGEGYRLFLASQNEGDPDPAFHAAPNIQSRSIQLSQCRLDLVHHHVLIDEHKEPLSSAEASLLTLLLSKPGEVFSREHILREVWEDRKADSSRLLDNTVWRIRSKIEPDPSNPVHLLTVRGKGYAFDPNHHAPTGEVSIVFTDIQGSTRLWEQLGDIFATTLEIHDGIIRTTLDQHQGYEVKTDGDAFMLAFHTPYNAVMFCVNSQMHLETADWPTELLNANDKKSGPRGLSVRMGVSLGTPHCIKNHRTDRWDYRGPMVNRAARLGLTAHGGQILLSDSTHDAIRNKIEPETASITSLGVVSFRGMAGEETLWQCAPASLSHRDFPPLKEK